ncbi:MAG: hypothetical protein PHC34_08955 [Candidatus Gastranaerophilales bacterium]|nr:hypothetical protein [Candidatus Gastranaerophilales bacterium]
MYIFEIIAKIIRDYKRGKNSFRETGAEEDYEKCEHVYYAIDSTKDYLACTKCGNVIKNQHKEKINIFKV